MSTIQFLFCSNEKSVDSLIDEEAILINLRDKNAIKISEFKINKGVYLKSSKSESPNQLLNGIMCLLEKNNRKKIIVGTAGLSYHSIEEIINYFRFEEKSNNNFIFVFVNDKLIDCDLITISESINISLFFKNRNIY